MTDATWTDKRQDERRRDEAGGETKPGLAGRIPGALRPEDLCPPPEVVQRNWGWMLALGIALIIGGTTAVLMPVLASIAVEGIVGGVMLAAGALQLVHVFRASDWSVRGWSALSAAVYLVGGVLLVLNPFAGLIALSALMVAIFLVDGIARIVMGVKMRPERGWGWVTAGGAVTLALAVMIFGALPGASLWVIGLLAGLSLIFEGWGAVFLAFAARRARRESGGSDRASDDGAGVAA